MSKGNYLFSIVLQYGFKNCDKYFFRTPVHSCPANQNSHAKYSKWDKIRNILNAGGKVGQLYLISLNEMKMI